MAVFFEISKLSQRRTQLRNSPAGQFIGVDFNEMTRQGQSDWAIQYTNTLMESEGNNLDTGAGQHGRTIDEIPSQPLKPITQ